MNIALRNKDVVKIENRENKVEKYFAASFTHGFLMELL